MNWRLLVLYCHENNGIMQIYCFAFGLRCFSITLWNMRDITKRVCACVCACVCVSVFSRPQEGGMFLLIQAVLRPEGDAILRRDSCVSAAER